MSRKSDQLPRHVRLPVLANLLGLTERRVNALVDAGIIPRVSRGLYPIPESITGYCEHMRRHVSGDGAGRGLTALRGELIAEQVKLARLERQARERELLPADQVSKVWEQLTLVARTNFLALPSRAAARLEGLNVAAIKQTLMTEVREVLSHLAHTEVTVGEQDGEIGLR